MSDESTTDQLHLPNLSITNFRGIDHLVIPRLGRVTLIAGHNGVGKTTVLEAVQVYAARGRYAVLNNLLHQHEEFVNALDEDDNPHVIPDIAALFHGREPKSGSMVSVGPTDEQPTLTMQLLSSSVWTQEQRKQFSEFDGYDDVLPLQVQFQDTERFLPWVVADEFQSPKTRSQPRRGIPYGRWAQDWPKTTNCQALGPGLLDALHLANLWSDVALTQDEERTTEALQLLHGGIERVAVVGSTQFRREIRILVKFADQDKPVPLQSLGDGAVRIFGVALALANSHNGFLVIDEAENGIHHSAQKDFWSLVLRTAQQNNVQVLATTHSWDCVEGFAQASVELDDVEGVLVRLEGDQNGIRAVEYTEADLAVAAEQRIEVR